MPLAIGTQIDTNRIPVKGMIPEQSASSPAAPVEGLFWHDTANKQVKIYLNGAWMTLGAAGAGGPPSGNAGGDLGSTYPNPTVLKAQTGFTIGGTAAVLTNDARLSDARTPSGTISGDLAGSTWPNLQIAAGAIVIADFAAALTLDALATSRPPIASVPMNNQRITGLLGPAGANDAATRGYVDGVVQGLDAKASVRAATTANIANLASGAPNTLDGVTLAGSDRILVKDQTTQAQNGIYYVSSLGTGANGIWLRDTDMDVWGEVPSAYTWVEQGTVNADTGWVVTADQGGTLGTTAITWTQFSGAGTISAGTGLTKTGSTLALDTAYTDARYAPISVVGTVKKYNATLGALTAGAETLITHSLGTTEVIAQFRDATSNYEIAFGWRVVSTTQIGVTPDIAYAANAVKTVVIG